MPSTVRLEHVYAAPPQRLWDAATSWEGLEASMKGIATYYGLPRRPLAEGQKIEVEVSIFGILPRMTWTMEIRKFEPENMHLRSFEHGGAVKSWEHDLRVEPADGGARLVDTVAVDAGWLTPVYIAWARYMYSRRDHARRAQLDRPPG